MVTHLGFHLPAMKMHRFHADKLSSAHVYLRLERDQDWTDIPEGLLQDLAQLTKANSIEGNKKNNVVVVYTPWSNLKKTGDMAVGQVSFHNHKLVRRVHVEIRSNEIVNRLNKTKQERDPDLQEERAQRDRELRALERKQREKEDLEARKQKEQWRREKEERDYGRIFDEDQMKSNRMDVEDVAAAEEDFM